MALLKPEEMWLGPSEQLIVDDDAISMHPEPLAKMVRLLASIALRCGASRLTLQPGKDEYELFVVVDNQRVDLRPPPIHLSQCLPEVVKAIAGIDLADELASSSGDVTIRVPGASPEDWPMRVSLMRIEDGERITFDFPMESVPDFELLEGLRVAE